MHLSGRTRWAFGLGVLGALVRPELWVLLALYARVHVVADAALPAGRWPWALVIVPALWIGLDWWGSGDLLHGGSVARSTPPESAALTDRPALTVSRRAGRARDGAAVLAAAGGGGCWRCAGGSGWWSSSALATALWVAARGA